MPADQDLPNTTEDFAAKSSQAPPSKWQPQLDEGDALEGHLENGDQARQQSETKVHTVHGFEVWLTKTRLTCKGIHTLSLGNPMNAKQLVLCLWMAKTSWQVSAGMSGKVQALHLSAQAVADAQTTWPWGPAKHHEARLARAKARMHGVELALSQCHCIWVIHLQMGFSCLSHKEASKDNEKS